jgi:phosphatidate cytidylyltransferase
MDDQRRFRRDKKDDPPSEGVRIIGPDEAAEAMERGDVASRRGGDEPRYGDRPAQPPAGPRPALRFPLDATADPSRIERPPVQPAPDPVTGPVELPHWSEPATGEVPAVLIGDGSPLLDDDGGDADAWSSFATSTPRWRDADDDWADDDFVTSLAEHSEEVRVGALADGDRPSQDEYYGFDDFDERVEERTSSGHSTIVDQPRWVEDDDEAWAASDERDDEDEDRWAPPASRDDRDGDRRDDRYDDETDEAFGEYDDEDDDYDEEPYTGEVEAYTGEVEAYTGEQTVVVDDEDVEVDVIEDLDEDVEVEDVPPTKIRTTGALGGGDDRETSDLEEVRNAGDTGGAEDDANRPDRAGRPDDDGYELASSGGGDRDMVTAIGVGVGLAAVALVAMFISPKIMVALVAGVLAYAAYEYFTQLNNAEWETAGLIGVVTCAAMPIAAYWRGPQAVAMLLFIAVVALFGWFLVGAGGRDPHVMESSGATILGIVWIGVLGSAAGSILALPKGRGLLITAVLATVAYDAGGLFIGKYMGHHPLSPVSPNKTREGAAGGMGLACIITLICVGVVGLGPWTGVVAALVLGIGAACAAPLGDLCQSQLKRDLRIKDMGSILPGHGGILDRFDSMLFVLPTVFWLTYAIGLS